MDDFQIGDKVLFRGFKGRVCARSGSDSKIIVEYSSRGTILHSNWIDMAEVSRIEEVAA